MSESTQAKRPDYTQTTITFDRNKLYDPHNGNVLQNQPLVALLGLITATMHQTNRLETLQALQERGITVHDHYKSANGSTMYGPIPAADAELI